MIGFTAFVLLAGMILGIIIDGIHHSFIETGFIKNIPELKKISNYFKYIMKGDDLELSNYYRVVAWNK